MEFKLNLPHTEKNKMMIKIISPMIGKLTSKEIDILVTMLDKNIYSLNKNTRTEVRMFLNMDKFNFNNYMSKLKIKKILLLESKDILKLNPKIQYILKHESLNITFV